MKFGCAHSDLMSPPPCCQDPHIKVQGGGINLDGSVGDKRAGVGG